MTPRALLLKLALRACERGDTEAAAEALRGVLGMVESEPAPRGELRAVSRSHFAAMLGATPEHVGHLIKRGEIPADALLGKGRGLRIVVDAALAALKHGKPAPTQSAEPTTGDAVEDEGAQYVRRRSALRVVRGTGGRS